MPLWFSTGIDEYLSDFEPVIWIAPVHFIEEILGLFNVLYHNIVVEYQKGVSFGLLG